VRLFADCHERIRRADEHARTFINSYLRFLNDKPYGITHEMRDERNGVVKLVPHKFLDPKLPLILGEFFYQLRASLDGAVWEAYQRLGGLQTAPKLKEERLDFPFAKSPGNFKDSSFNAFPFSDLLKGWVESMQPYNVPSLVKGSEDQIISEALILVNDCARKDRHRKLHLVGTVVTAATSLIDVGHPAKITYVTNVPADPLKGQYEIARFGVEGLTPEMEIQVNTNFTLHVAVQEISDDADLMIRLYHLKDTVMGVVRRFEQAVP